MLDNFEFVDSKQDSQSSGKPTGYGESTTAPLQDSEAEPKTPTPAPEADPDLDEDVPF